MLRGLEASVLVAFLVAVPVAAAVGPASAGPPVSSTQDSAFSGSTACDVTVVAPAGPVQGGCVGVEVHPDRTSYVVCYFDEEITICQTQTLPGYGSALP